MAGTTQQQAQPSLQQPEDDARADRDVPSTGLDYDDDVEVATVQGGAMHPDHPLLARAQAALKRQLLDEQQRLQEEVREKHIMMNNARAKREGVGIELYGFQQSLAKLQLQLEQTHQNHQVISRLRGQAEQDLQALRRTLKEDEGATAARKAEVEAQQLDLDRLAATLKQVEAYNESMKGEIAVVRRAAYAAESAAAVAERSKLAQDVRIDEMQGRVKAAQQALALHTAQVEAQSRETRAAQETLAEAESEMAGVHFEKKQLVAQWKSSLTAIAKRDEALAVIQEALRAQQQQELSIATEIRGYKKDILKQQLANERVTAVAKKVEAESGYLAKQVETVLERQGRLADELAKLGRALEHAEAQMTGQTAEAAALANETAAVDRAAVKVSNEVRAIEEEILITLSDQTTTEKSSHKTAADIRALRKKVRDEELVVADAQNELAKLQVDVLNTEAHNTRLGETLALLEEELAEKSAAVEKYELEIKRRNDEIEKKTREIDLLNRKLERLNGGADAVANGGEALGPLEATIKNLQHEIDTKGAESEDMQRRWIQAQTELVALQNENTAATETVTRMRAEATVLTQRKRRLESELDKYGRDVRGLQASMGRLHVQLQRLNALIADNAAAREALAEDNGALQARIAGELRDMEAEAAALASAIEGSRQHKRDALSEIVEVERQIMLWERKLMLEKEMQDVLDPSVGQDVVGEMKREIHRMQLRLGELGRLQEKLMADIEKALSKRELIAVKGRATLARAKQAAPSGRVTARDVGVGGGTIGQTRGQLSKAVSSLERSVRDTQKELSATDGRLASLEAHRQQLQATAGEVEAAVTGLRTQQEQLQGELSSALASKYKLMLATSRQQKQAKRYEDMAAGRYKPLVEDPSALDGELTAAGVRLEAVLSLCDALRKGVPQLGLEVDKVLCHVADV